MSALLLSATACTSGGGEQGSDEDEYNMTADEVCQGTLAGSADSLEARARSEEFGEIEQSPSYTPADYADVLMENETVSTDFCVIFAPVVPDSRFANIVFSWSALVPEPGARPEQTYYDISPLASAGDHNARILLTCPVGAAPEDELLQAELTMYDSGSGSDHDDMIAILNSAAYAVVEALGCTEESGLTPEPPARWEAPA
ncbi:hypothetical protein [Streptomyces radicis]|uniref:DUF3558 domain-containing protein n=1 Tax=Streptomyces radicis TaxID=1750517 RepID=A0A3A9VX40_9ACTN|nr:hypothetical protein [Streptomyces radicis]RKN05072.1 hypothetical protein D7319_26255 [Streptomyces radicis]RKN16398.1 hypothetical protein D7318_25620 [Streptomyces radicis]